MAEGQEGETEIAQEEGDEQQMEVGKKTERRTRRGSQTGVISKIDALPVIGRFFLIPEEGHASGGEWTMRGIDLRQLHHFNGLSQHVQSPTTHFAVR